MNNTAAMMVWNTSSSSSSSSSSVHENGQQQLGGWRKGPWTPEEDKLLLAYVKSHGEGRWSSVARSSGLNRSGKSCRLRWVNYLRPGLKRGHITLQEEGIIIELHALWGNKWSTIARYLPGRTDNEIKNYWRTHFKKKPVNKTTSSHHKKDEQKVQAILHEEMINHQQQQSQSVGVAQDDPMANAVLHENKLEKEATGASLEPMIGYWPWELDDDEDVLWGGLWNYMDPVPAQPGRMGYNQNEMVMQTQNQAEAGLVFP